MTTPSDESAAHEAQPAPAEAVTPEATPAASADAPTAAVPAATPAAAPAPPPQAFGPHVPYSQTPAYADPAFAPVARAPRTPWVNPARRTRVAVVSAAVGLALLGGGLVTGFAIGHHAGDHGDRFGNVRMMPGRMLPDQGLPGMPGPRGGGYDGDGPWMHMGPGNGNVQVPPGMPGRRNYPGAPGPGATATPSPSSSTSR